MATFSNQSRNTSTFTNADLGNYATWSDTTISWASSFDDWAGFRGDVYSKQSRNTSAFTNQTKN